MKVVCKGKKAAINCFVLSIINQRLSIIRRHKQRRLAKGLENDFIRRYDTEAPAVYPTVYFFNTINSKKHALKSRRTGHVLMGGHRI